ncbi:Rpn family recombination-promoting nuclease/putative transposase [Bernardetia sp. ABR2-2B]|uniref:Rpn family recombination-promoting nuclease/putative transposase n=1 Tax=Bernardetia sp. ABR2-2B TaxID=3127472 RepID=UPI0030CE2C15
MKLIHFDWAIKKLLRHKENFGILEGFLTELLKFDLKIERILESEGNQEEQRDKFNRVDILVRTTKGELVLVELQNTPETDYFQRMLYGVSKLLTEYFKLGESYERIKRFYSINIVYGSFGQGEDYIYQHQGSFVGTHSKDNLENENFPKYYILKVNNFDDVVKNTLDEWIYFLKKSEVKDEFKAKGMEEVREKMCYEKLDKDSKIAYNRFQENLRIAKSIIETGRKTTILEIAKDFKNAGIAIHEIAKSTGLSEEEINDL